MTSFYCIFVLGLACTTLADFNFQAKPCSLSDSDCLLKIAQNFMDSVNSAVPEYGTKTIDPITIPAIDKFPDGTEISFNYKDLKVTGFKDQKVSSFNLDKDTRTVNLKTRVNLNFDGDLSVKLQNLYGTKPFMRTIKGNASAEASSIHTYSITTDDKGVKHFKMGPETITCEILGKPTFSPDDELRNLILNDSDQYRKYKKMQHIIHQETVCDIVKMVFATTMNNLKLTAQAIPASMLVTDA